MPEIDLNKMEMLLSVDLQANIDSFVIEFGRYVDRLRLQGVSDEEINKLLEKDLKEGGRVFGQFKNGLRNAVVGAINQASNEASMTVFTDHGIKEFKWITVSGNPCPDCTARHGQVESMEYWRTVGLPGSGFSVCQSNCKCRLVPESYKGQGLEKPIIRKKVKR
jgi:hypothetical protein